MIDYTKINKLYTWDEKTANGRWFAEKIRTLAIQICNNLLWLPPREEFDFCLNVSPDTASALNISTVLEINMNEKGDKIGAIFGVPVYIDKDLEDYSWKFGYLVGSPHRAENK